MIAPQIRARVRPCGSAMDARSGRGRRDVHRTLILTDDADRGQRLARNLGGGAHIAVHDLYGDEPAPAGAGLLIADVSAVTSESVLRLRRTLSAVRGEGVPLLYLIHGNVGRGEIQATALGATRSLPAMTATAMLLNAVAGLHAAVVKPPAAAGPQRHVEEARAAFSAIFRGNEPPAPPLVDSGTEIVSRAIRATRVRDWLDVVARFDDVTHRHCLTVAGLAAAFASALGLREVDAHRLTKGALLHDIGKARVPLAILNKPGPLTPEERREMDRHPVLGHEMLTGSGYDAMMLGVVRSHHEFLDGSGYPDGLAAGAIPDLVRLVTICDIFAALIEWRPYKAPKTAEQAYAALTGMGSRLDADLVRAFGPVAAACGSPMRAAS
jgi:putative nucleotidyltransferase with HDIG domain